jgi:3-oxoacyl-[acyl-carrier-protein] synthase II
MIRDGFNARRVVVTGVGCITPLGTEVSALWEALKQGHSGVDYTSIFDASRFPTKISAEVRGWDVDQVGLNPEAWKLRGRHSKFAAGAATKAVRDAGILDTTLDPTRFGVYLGSGEGQQDFLCFARMMASALRGDAFVLALFTKAGLEWLHPTVEMEQEPNMPAGHLAAMFDAQGPNANCLTACAASSQASTA